MSQETKVVFGILALCIVLLGGIIFFYSASQEKANMPVDSAVLVREDSPTIKAEGASVTLVEFIDPECEACRAMHPIVKKALDEYKSQITYVVRYFPLHENSVLAAKTLEASGEQGKYWEMMDKLFLTQSEWGEQQTPQTELFKEYAQELGLDMTKFNTVIESNKYEDKVTRDRTDGVEVGVRGTPTFFINGVKLQNLPQSYDAFKVIIDKAIKD